jgi:hypothetical protein
MKKIICTLITIGLVISFTSCNSKELSTLNNQSQTSNKIITSNPQKQLEPNSDGIYTPPEQSREELYQDIFVSLLVPSIQKSVAGYYKTYLTESPIVSPNYIYVLNAERLGGYRSYSFNVKLKVSSYIGPHLNIGDDYITLKIEGAGNVTVEKFEHVKSYYQDLPSNYQNIIIKRSN